MSSKKAQKHADRERKRPFKEAKVTPVAECLVCGKRSVSVLCDDCEADYYRLKAGGTR